MKLFYSKVEEGKLLHVVNRFNEISNRTDIVPDDNFIQCATLRMKKGKTFRAHKHIKKYRTYEEKIAQESWVIIQGKVKCYFYDLDDKLLTTVILEKGDPSKANQILGWSPEYTFNSMIDEMIEKWEKEL